VHPGPTSPDSDRLADRRSVLRGAGAVLLAASLAGCYHDEAGSEDGGGGDGGGGDGGDGDGGGDYSMGERRPAPE
jgi:hypothetical protein